MLAWQTYAGCLVHTNERTNAVTQHNEARPQVTSEKIEKCMYEFDLLIKDHVSALLHKVLIIMPRSMNISMM